MYEISIRTKSGKSFKNCWLRHKYKIFHTEKEAMQWADSFDEPVIINWCRFVRGGWGA